MNSAAWGGADFPISQGFGVNLDSVPDSWYGYAAEWGLRAGDHAGLDIAMPVGTPIYAVAGGLVTQAGPSPYFRPNPVHVVTADDPATAQNEQEEHIYGHLWRSLVAAGQRVRAGDQLGTSGEQTRPGTMTPDGSGPHLHFERRHLATQRVLDPTPLLTGAPAGIPAADGGSSGGGLSGAVDRAASGLADVAKRAGLAILGALVLGLGLFVVFPALGNALPARGRWR